MTLASDLLGAEAVVGEQVTVFRGLSQIDWLVIGTYAMGMVLLGIHCVRRQKNTDDYFIAGGKMGSFVIGVSIYATLLSTISYLAIAGEVINHGPIWLVSICGTPIVFVLVGFWLIPALMKRQVTSAYELLEARLGLPVRLLGACMFVALRLMWMGLMLHVAAKAVVVIMGIPEADAEAKIPWIILISGVIAVSYTSLGGLRAVVITDVVQFFLLLGGAVMTIALVSKEMGGFGWWPTTWYAHWDVQPGLPNSIHDRVTILGSIISTGVWWVCTAGADQTVVQRYMATGSAKKARRSYLINSIIDMSLAVLLGLVGLVLLAYYSQPGQLLPGTGGLKAEADHLFPHFIANRLPIGIAGLVVAAMFAALMSSLDSGVNAVSAVVVTDFVGRLHRVRRSAAKQLWIARWTTLGLGIMIVLAGIMVGQVPGNILEVANKTVNLLTSPMFGLFFLALFVRFATPFGAVQSAIYGSIISFLVAFWDVLTGYTPISFQWIGLVGLVTSVVTGVGFSLFPTQRLSRLKLVGWGFGASLPAIVALAWAISKWWMLCDGGSSG